MKRVLFITVRADMGGGPKHVFDLCKNLNSIDIHIACPNEAPFYEKYKTITENVIEIPHRKFSIIKFFKLIQYCKDNGISIIHSHGRGAGIYSRLMTCWGLKVIHTFHGVHNEPSIIGRIKLFIDKFFSNMSDINIYVSEDECEIGQSLRISTKYNSEVILNGIETLKIEPSDNMKKLGTVARLTYQKGIDELITHFSNLDESYELFIAGDGEKRHQLELMVKNLNLSNRITFLGKTNGPEVLLEKIGIYVSSARWEGLPLSVLEAMSIGLPIVISDVVGHRDIQSKFPEKISYKNSDEFRKIINSISNGYAKYSNTSKHVQKNYFSIEKMVKETQKLYFKIL